MGPHAARLRYIAQPKSRGQRDGCHRRFGPPTVFEALACVQCVLHGPGCDGHDLFLCWCYCSSAWLEVLVKGAAHALRGFGVAMH